MEPMFSDFFFYMIDRTEAKIEKLANE